MMANRLLPAVKRYAVGTEPVRDAAKVCFTHNICGKILTSMFSSGRPSTNRLLKCESRHMKTFQCTISTLSQKQKMTAIQILHLMTTA